MDPEPADPAGPPTRIRWLSFAALGVAVLLAFSGVGSNSWIALDDSWYIVENPRVNSGFNPANFAYFLGETHGGNWHPLTSWSHLLDVQLFGLNPGAHHLVGLALHCANVLLLAWVLYRMTGAWWRSILAAALFGLHPLRVESVAWASERKDVLSTLFLLLTLETYRGWVRRPGRLRFLAVMLALALGLMSKPMLVTVPVLLLLLDLWPLGRLKGLPKGFAPHPDLQDLPRRSLSQLVVEKWPLFLIAAAAAAATLWAQSASHAVISSAALPLWDRVTNALVTCWRYVGMTLWPVDLIPFYPGGPIGAAYATAAAAGLFAVTATLLGRWRMHPGLTVGWGWYLVSLLPVIGLVQVGGQAYADRYTYVPTIGLMIVLVWLPWRRRAAQAAAVAAVAIIAALGVLTHRQVSLWKDTRTLFTHTLQVSPRNAVAYNCLGLAKLADGDEEGALHDFRTAVALDPSYRDPFRNLARVLNMRNECAEALRYCEAGMRIYPDAGLLEQAAMANHGLGRLDEAERLYRRSLEQDPENVLAVRNLAVVRSQQGRSDDAIALLSRAERMDPGDSRTQLILGKVLYLEGGRTDLAIEHLRRAIRLRSDWAEPPRVLAEILMSDPDTTLRDPGEAVRLATRAVELTSGESVEALRTQAAAMAAAGRYADAVSAQQAALRLAEQNGPDSLAAPLRLRLETYQRRARTEGPPDPA